MKLKALGRTLCDLYVKSSTLQMTAQDPNVMIARVFNHLPLALKLSVSENSLKSLLGMGT
jgi:hypothetical protein